MWLCLTWAWDSGTWVKGVYMQQAPYSHPHEEDTYTVCLSGQVQTGLHTGASLNPESLLPPGQPESAAFEDLDLL